MGFDLPALPSTGDVATISNWAEKVRNSLQYLKGDAGTVTIDSSLTLASGSFTVNSGDITTAGGSVVTALLRSTGLTSGGASLHLASGNVNVVSGEVTAAGANLTTHKTRHQKGGADEINVSGLTGLLATTQHAATTYYVVAASNASTESKLAADYICDGTDDDVEIQAAIAAVHALGGGIVDLSEGDFTIGAQLDYANVSNVVLRGKGHKVTTITLASDVNATMIGSSSGTPWTYGNIFEDFLLDGNSDNQTAGSGISFTLSNWCSVVASAITDCGSGILNIHSNHTNNMIRGLG